MLAGLFNRGSGDLNDGKTLEETIEQAQSDPNSIGNLAIEMGWCTLNDITEALAVQRKRLRLDQILVDLGKLTEEQRDDLWIEQRIRRGKKVSAEELRKHERRKFHRRVSAVTERFREAGAEAKSTAAIVMACVSSAIES